MRILLTNDDGIQAPGLQALEQSLRALGECLVVAPDVEQSATSHAFTMHRPLRLKEIRPGWHSVSGTPADAVYVGLHHLCVAPPDLVVSGINRGANVCQDILYSGTVAAALEAAMAGVPALAVSMLVDWAVPPTLHHWATPARFAREVASRMASHPLPPGTVLNLNVPDLPWDQVGGLRVTRMGRRTYSRRVDVRADPRGRPYCWIGGDHLGFDGEPDTDGTALGQGHATLTPLQVDLTRHSLLSALSAWNPWGPPEGGP